MADSSKLFYYVATRIVFPECRQSYAHENRGYSWMGMTKTIQILARVLLKYSSSTVSLLLVLLLWSNVVKIIFLYLGFLMHGIDINYIVWYSLTRQHDMCQGPNILCCSQQPKSQNWYTVKGHLLFKEGLYDTRNIPISSDRRRVEDILCNEGFLVRG